MDSEARWRSGSEAVGHGLGGAVAQWLGGGGAWLGGGGEWLVAHHFVSPDTPDFVA
jgi:hypothetical protein